jgi:hypothetical protein
MASDAASVGASEAAAGVAAAGVGAAADGALVALPPEQAAMSTAVLASTPNMRRRVDTVDLLLCPPPEALRPRESTGAPPVSET